MAQQLDRVAPTNDRRPATPPRPRRAGAVAAWADDRLGLATAAREEPAQGVPRPLVVHARRDRAVVVRGPAADRRVPDPLVRAEHVGVDVPGHLPPAARRPDVRRLRLDAAHLLRRPRRAAGAADAPLGRDALRRRDDDPPDAGGVHRRLPQAPRAELGDRQHPAAARDHRGLHRLLAARRPALRHRPRRRPTASSRPRRWSAPTCRSSSSAGSSRATRSSRGSTPCTCC